jgi:hypothetical protein
VSRPLRFIPDGGALVEVTSRTIHSRFLLRPGRELDEIIAGVLGRAQRRYNMRIAIVVSGEDGAQIERLKYLLANGCKEGLVARPQDWPC